MAEHLREGSFFPSVLRRIEDTCHEKMRISDFGSFVDEFRGAARGNSPETPVFSRFPWEQCWWRGFSGGIRPADMLHISHRRR